jgi:hypothetical protein
MCISVVVSMYNNEIWPPRMGWYYSHETRFSGHFRHYTEAGGQGRGYPARSSTQASSPAAAASPSACKGSR